MSRRKKNNTRSFESLGMPNDSFLRVYESMLTSEAFKSLTKNQKLLYFYMKCQLYGKKRKPKYDYPDLESVQGDGVFYFNRYAAVSKYGLYSDGNRKSLYDDIKALKDHGFIKIISSGRTTKSNSIYEFSSDWKYWKDSS